MVRIISDGSWAHEEVWQAWLDKTSCCVKPHYLPDPTDYLQRYKGPPALFQYVKNSRGGFDLLPFEWKLFERRWSNPVTPAAQYMDVTWALLDNNVGYGLTFGRLYPRWLGKRTVPFTGLRDIARTIDTHQVTCIICDANFLADHLTQSPPQGGSLKAVINVCRTLPVAKAEAIEAAFGVPVFTTLGDQRMGLVTWDRAKDLQRNSWGTFKVPTETRGKSLYVKPPCPWGDTDANGWLPLEL